MYILDTSAIRSISKINLIALAKKVDVYISPLSFLEILCHIDETDKQKTFKKQKGNLLKCKIPTLLDDPFAEHALFVGSTDDINQTRFEDKEMIHQLIKLIDESTSIIDLESKILVYPDGKRCNCKDIGDHIRSILDEEEKNYIKKLKQYKDVLLERKPESHKVEFGSKELAEVISGLLNNSHTSSQSTLQSLFIYTGYIINRLVQYLNKRPGFKGDIFPDRNDCEDSYIALHLKLFSGSTLVTNDKGTISAIEKTIESLRTIQPENIDLGVSVEDASKVIRLHFEVSG